VSSRIPSQLGGQVLRPKLTDTLAIPNAAPAGFGLAGDGAATRVCGARSSSAPAERPLSREPVRTLVELGVCGTRDGGYELTREFANPDPPKPSIAERTRIYSLARSASPVANGLGDRIGVPSALVAHGAHFVDLAGRNCKTCWAERHAARSLRTPTADIGGQWKFTHSLVPESVWRLDLGQASSSHASYCEP